MAYNRRILFSNLSKPCLLPTHWNVAAGATKDCFLTMDGKPSLHNPSYRWLSVSATNCKVPRIHTRMAEMLQGNPEESAPQENPPRQYEA